MWEYYDMWFNDSIIFSSGKTVYEHFWGKIGDCNAKISLTPTGFMLDNAASYQWYRENTKLPGDTNQTLVPDSGFKYHASVTFTNGCNCKTYPVYYTPSMLPAAPDTTTNPGDNTNPSDTTNPTDTSNNNSFITEHITRSSNQVSIKPNPARYTTEVTVQEGNCITEVVIWELGGRKVFQQQVNKQKSISIPVSGFSAGIYIIEARLGTGVVFEKLIINK